MERKKIKQQVQVLRNLAQPLILDINSIHNLGVTYLTGIKEFVFQRDILQSKFSKADLKTESFFKIPASTTSPVRLGTAIGTRHTPMTECLKLFSTISNIDHP
jgi:hypothetical protein